MQVATGNAHSCARLEDGGVQCWGFNNIGQLGTGPALIDDCRRSGAVSPRNCAWSAQTVPGLADVVDISAFGSTTCVVRSDGSVACWGDGSNGKLGDGGSSGSDTPVDVPGVSSARRVVLSDRTACAILDDDSVACWGQTVLLGSGSSASGASMATAVSGLSGVTDIAASDRATCAIYGPDAQVACWGSNTNDAIGTSGPSGANVLAPSDLPGVRGATDLAMGRYFGCALLGQQIRCWGQNTRGQFATGTTASSREPVDVPGLLVVAEVDLFDTHACARATSGALACWGSNANGRLGLGSVGGTFLTAVQVPGFRASAFATDDDKTCAADPSGDVWCWGRVYDESAGAFVDVPTPQRLFAADGTTPFGGVVELHGARRNMCFRRDDGTLWCMGEGDVGVLGNGSRDDSFGVPVQVLGLTDVRAFDVNGSHACAVEGDGRAYCWGSNANGALGKEGSTGGRFPSPQQVRFYDDMVQIHTADQDTCVLRATGDLACWGGLLAGATTTPVAVSGLAGDLRQLDAAARSICAVTDVSGASPTQPGYCWNSDNTNGEMGNGTQTPVPSPTQVLTFDDFDSVAVGLGATCAVRAARSAVACWGVGSVLGDGSGVMSTTPVTVVGFP